MGAMESATTERLYESGCAWAMPRTLILSDIFMRPSTLAAAVSNLTTIAIRVRVSPPMATTDRAVKSFLFVPAGYNDGLAEESRETSRSA